MTNFSKLWSSDTSQASLAVLLAITSPFWMTYLYTYVILDLGRRFGRSRRPPWKPYWIPVLGHSIQFATKPFALWDDALERFGRGSMFGILLLNLGAYQATTPEQVAKLFRAKGMIETEGHALALQQAFGMPKESVDIYANDNSGYGVKPAPDSLIPPDQRIMLKLHNFLAKGLGGEGLSILMREYQTSLRQQYAELAVSVSQDEWLDIPDLVHFFRDHIMQAALYAIFGPHLLRLNPNFIEDFWAFNPTMATLFLGVPRWMVTKAYDRRDRLVDCIEKYHEFARETYSGIGNEDWEEAWGSKFSRERDSFFLSFNGLGKRARASEDLSFIWASNANSVEAATWMIIEALRDHSLLGRLQKEFATAAIPSNGAPSFDTGKLMSCPLAQSTYAEVLRMRVSVNVSRMAKEDLEFDGFRIEKGERVAGAMQLLGHDPDVWNKGPKQSLKDFWPDRFLVYPDDPKSGPLKNPKPRKSTEKQEEGPRYTMDGLAYSWIPYSGGSRHCPGRHFAKQEIILTAAMTLATFEIELLTEKDWEPQPDVAYYGFGTMPVKGKVPCRIRRRRPGTE